MLRLSLNRRVSIWVVSTQLMLMFSLSTLPTPLYASYATQFHISSLTLTIIFAAYTIGTLSTLFFLGRLSDQIGRRKTSLAAISLAVLAALAFIFVKDTEMLFAARVTTGLATGLSAGTAIAWIRDLYGSAEEKSASQRAVSFNIFGLGFGPLFSGILAAFAPAPTKLVYVLFIALLFILALGIFLAKETVQKPRPVKEVSLKPRIGVPHEVMSRFLAPALTIFVTFSLVGFYSVIAPGLLSKVLHQHSLATIGSTVFELFFFGTISAYIAFKFSSRDSMLSGVAMMLPALGLLIAAQQLQSFASLLAGTAFGGVSLGLSYRGALEVINLIAPSDHRAEMVSSLFVVGNLSLAIPVIGVGILSVSTSQAIANTTFAIVVLLFSLAGLFMAKRLNIQV